MPRSIFTIGALPGVSIEGAYIHPENIEKVRKLIAAMPEIETRAYQKACTNFGKMLAKYVRKCIMSNTPPEGVSWPPHSDDYLKKYNVQGFWYLSGQMLRSIRLRQYQGGYYVGPNPGEKAVDPVNKYERSRPSKLTLVQLARILEGGTEGHSNSKFHNDIPARPLFRPSFKAVGGTERLKKYLISNLRREVKKYL